MFFAVRQGLSLAAVSAAVIGGLAGGAATAAAQPPSLYDPVITPCSHLFRTPIEGARPGAPMYWSPFGTTDIACYDNGAGPVHYYQRDPWGAWHDMNELSPGHFFYSIFTTGIPDQARWG